MTNLITQKWLIKTINFDQKENSISLVANFAIRIRICQRSCPRRDGDNFVLSNELSRLHWQFPCITDRAVDRHTSCDSIRFTNQG